MIEIGDIIAQKNRERLNNPRFLVNLHEKGD